MRLRRIVAVAAGLLLLLVLALVALVALVPPSAVARQFESRVLPRVEERLGRAVTVDGVSVDLFPLPTVRLSGLSVAGAAGEPPLVSAGEAQARIALWPLARSLGKELRVRSVELERPEVNLVRRRNGTWSYEDVLERLTGAPGAPSPVGAGPAAPAGAGPAGQPPTSRRVAVDRFAIEDGLVRLVDHAAAGGTGTVELTGIDLTARGLEPGGKLELALAAALQSSKENLHANLVVDPLPARFEGLAPEAWPELRGDLKLQGVPVSRLEAFLPGGLAEVVSGGAVDLRAELATRPDRSYAVDGGAEIRDLALRDQPAHAELALRGTAPPGNPGAMVVRITRSRVKGPGVDLGATASIEGLPPREVKLAVQGPLLDLGAVLAALPAEKTGGSQAAAERTPLPEATRQRLQGVKVEGTLDIARVVRGKLQASDLKADATLANGVLTLRTATAGLYQGTLDASGTRVDLRAAVPRWKLVAQLQGVELAAALGEVAGKATVGGKASGKLELSGAGADWKAIRQAVTGDGTIAVTGGSLTTGDLDGALASALSAALSQAGLKGASSLAAGRGTKLDELTASFRVRNGALELGRPLRFKAPFGNVELGGSIGLDQGLDLKGTTELSPSFVAQATGGLAKPGKPVEVPLRIGGQLSAPEVSLPPDALASLLPRGELERRVGKEAGKAREKLRDEARRRAKDLLRGN